MHALTAADDAHQVAVALAEHLRSTLRLSAASVHEQEGGRLVTWATAGSRRRPYLARVARAVAGGTIDGGFAHQVEGLPHWIVLCDRDQPPSPEERLALQIAADTASVAAAAALRAGAERTAARTGRALVELGQALGLEHGETNVLHLLTLAVARLVENAGVATWLADEDGFSLVAAFGYPLRRRPPAGARVPLDEAIIELTSSRRIRFEPAERHPGLICREGHAIMVPIGERLANHALLVIERSTAPGEAEEALLIGVADQALLALENERLIEEQRRALDDVVACLGRALALRHRATGEHSDRMVADCVAVASTLGVHGEALRDVAFAAALHDLGKIGVPERVLDNSGPLDEEGWRLIHAHPELGAAIIDPVDALHGAAELVRCCHEHWDGSGYPRGLRGEQIPLGARVIFACDAYHAMREDRPYQASVSAREACKRLRSLAGIDFDPRVVDALLARLEHLRAAKAARTTSR